MWFVLIVKNLQEQIRETPTSLISSSKLVETHPLLHHSISLEVNLEALQQHQQVPLTFRQVIHPVQLLPPAVSTLEELAHQPQRRLNLLYLAILQLLLLRLRQTVHLVLTHPIPLHPPCPALDHKHPPPSKDMSQRSTH